MPHQLSAEIIAFALDKGRRIRADEYTACCPAHQDRSPSFSISQKADRVLLKCWSGCSQGEVLDALRARGLWPKEREQRLEPGRPTFTRDEIEYYHLYCLVYRESVRRGETPTPDEDARFRRFSGICYQHGGQYGL